MSFSQKLSDGFGKVLEKSPYTVQDPLVKVQVTTKGNNLILGRPLRDDDHTELIYVGKVLENTTGRTLLGYDTWLDITFPHVIYVTGTRGSGKSFDLGVIAEGIGKLSEPSALQNSVTPLTSIIIDTQSQFWTLRFPPRPQIPSNQEQLESLKKWNLRPNSVENTRVYIPPGSRRFLGDEIELRVRPADVNHEEWCALLGQDVYGPQGHVLAQTVDALAGTSYSIADMIKYVNASAHWPGIVDATRNAVAYKLSDYDRTGLFDPNGIQVIDLLKPAVCNVLMLRELRNEDKIVVTAVLARQLFTIMGDFHNRRKVARFFGHESEEENLPSRVWLFIDEAHVVIPKDGLAPARQALIEYVKRGRDAGLSLVIATQQPSAVDDRILSQVNVSFNHRLTFQADIGAAINRIPTKTVTSLKLSGTILTDFGDMIRILDAGQCFVGDYNTSRTVMLQVRPRVTAHGGYSPL